MTVENIDLKTIGFFSLVGQAYVFKFLWSPVMDRYTPPFLGRRRGWLVMTQVLLLLAIAAMGFLEPTTAPLDGRACGGDSLLFRLSGYRVRRPEDGRVTCGRARCRCGDQRAGLSPRDAGLRRAGVVAGRPLSRLAGYVLADGCPAHPCIIATLFAPEPSDVIPVPARWNRPWPNRCVTFGRNNAG